MLYRLRKRRNQSHIMVFQTSIWDYLRFGAKDSLIYVTMIRPVITYRANGARCWKIRHVRNKDAVFPDISSNEKGLSGPLV